MTKKELQDALDAMTQRAETAERSSKGRKENIIEIGGKLLRMTERAEAAEEEANRLRLEVAGIPALLQLARAEERERAEAAEAKLDEYKATRITVDEEAMVQDLREGKPIRLGGVSVQWDGEGIVYCVPGEVPYDLRGVEGVKPMLTMWAACLLVMGGE